MNFDCFYPIITVIKAPSFDLAQFPFSSNFLKTQELLKIFKIQFIISIQILIYHLKDHSLVCLFHFDILDSS